MPSYDECLHFLKMIVKTLCIRHSLCVMTDRDVVRAASVAVYCRGPQAVWAARKHGNLGAFSVLFRDDTL